MYTQTKQTSLSMTKDNKHDYESKWAFTI